MLNTKPPFYCKVTIDNVVRIWPTIKSIKPFISYLEDNYDWDKIDVYSKESMKFIESCSPYTCEIGFGFGEWIYEDQWFTESFIEKAIP